MFSFRGDAHKIYLQLKNQNSKTHKDISETAEIKAYYESLDRETLQLIYYRMIKEQNGTGIIPIYVSAIPWLLFLFSGKVEEILFGNGNLLWVSFASVYMILLTLSVLFHFKEKAWAAFHLEIIKDILES
ncbi:hypothetical protein [Virgibacillus halodenitrificans]|uniref:Uncharacterized protein n=1 Tax=Virgibacillus halodenitrificans TaxID=1482 RepID=A0AAC9NJW7_VIRHA|nr:hypothetical protein [Virgibacillus halodenitrificans]APC47947.1 hypothetical protein BME96_07070 [Virgibacillus halodenitrificans]MBD1224534.1 hypothetical protein [Virgibacillus halodenitrificans]MCG1028974.1 hypothetical protein [Virgibacillus halodenitrificans]MEC2160840.1 hypothetical protein [Virgibacillus halodenitrificans]CDQ37643.1 hypothetical protein BN993_07203 [Virgibacillus halodenitrificans]